MWIKKISSFVRLEHTLFALPLLFAGAYFPLQGWPAWRLTLLIILAGGSARIVAMALNRIIDREIDRRNPRTKDRHLATGSMSLMEAWGIVVVSLGIYLFTAWLISDFVLRISWIPLLGFTLYPYLKRFTRWSHVGLGLVWSMVPLGGFFAVNPSLGGIGPAVWLGAFCVFWLAGFDIIYATLDETFDREAGLYSLPAVYGTHTALKISAFFHALAYICLIFLYFIFLSGPLTVLVLLCLGILFFVEQKNAHKVDFAFLPINAVIGFVVLLLVVIGSKGY